MYSTYTRILQEIYSILFSKTTKQLNTQRLFLVFCSYSLITFLLVMKAILPVAGYATRLYPLTNNTSKALLEVSWVPLVGHCLNKIEQLGMIDTVYLVSNNNFFPLFQQRANHYVGPLHVVVVNDGTTSSEQRLWALGDIQFVLDQIGYSDDVLVLAGDNFFQDNLSWLYALFVEKKSSVIAVYDIWDRADAAKFGVVETADDGSILAFEEKPVNPATSMISTMIYMIKKDDLSVIQQCIDAWNADNGGNLIKTLIATTPVYTFMLEGYRYDIGNIEDLHHVRSVFGK